MLVDRILSRMLKLGFEEICVCQTIVLFPIVTFSLDNLVMTRRCCGVFLGCPLCLILNGNLISITYQEIPRFPFDIVTMNNELLKG